MSGVNSFFWVWVTKRDADKKQREYEEDEKEPNELVTEMELGCEKE